MTAHWSLLLTPIVLIVLAGSIPAQPPNREDLIRYAAESGEGTWRRANELPGSLSSRELFTYALALCEAKMHPDRLQKLFEVAAKMQDRDPQSRGYGNFRWSWEHPTVMDFNAVEFSMQAGALLWIRHRDAMPAEARTVLEEIIDYAVQGCLRHRVASSYTNIALMNAENLILLGESLGRPEVAEEGYSRLDQVCLYTWQNGTHEYCSPTYYGVDLECLLLIEAFCQHERQREQARALLELLWTDIACNWFEPSQRLAGARSRDYDYVRGLGHLDTALWALGWLGGPPRGSIGAIYPALRQWQPPARLEEMKTGHFPRTVRQSWGPASWESRTHYLCRDVTLSCSAANYWNMDIPLSVDLPGDRDYPRCYFIPDGRHDPYGKIKIPEASGAHEKTLHLRPFFTAAQRRVDALALVIYREKDLAEARGTLESHFVMPRVVDEIWVGPQRVKLEDGKPAEFPLADGQAVVLRKGSAAVGVRVPWARGLAGETAPVALVDDANPYGVIRLTITHHNLRKPEAPTANAGAALWVRVGSDLQTQEAFDQWRKAFAEASVEAQVSADDARFTAPAADGPLTVAASSPYAAPSFLDPAPSRAVLELDGEDIGRAILEKVEPMKSYSAFLTDGPVVSVSADQGAYWEAEAGYVMPQMTVGDDPQASGGQFVWVPGEPGGQASGSGWVTWRLNVEKAGPYYLWGRIMTPTPSDDSFFVRAVAGGKDVLPQAEWHTGVHATWEWVAAALNKATEPTAITLPKGLVTLELRAREDGAKIDRLYIAGRLDARPEG